jgi:hypothetical protein
MEDTGGDIMFVCEDSFPIAIGRPRLKISVNYLILDINGLVQANSANNARHCNLVIDEGLVSDKYGVSFLGLPLGQYALDFGDTVPPKLIAFSPKNGETNVEPSIVVTFFFSEAITFGPDAENLKVVLSRFDEGGLMSLAELELQLPRVQIEDQLLKVDLTGKIEGDGHYTISLPRGAVTDLEQNTFSGLEPRAYAFRTMPKVTQGQPTASQGLPLISFIAVGAGLILVLGTVILAVWKLSSLRAAYRQQASSGKLHSSGSLFVENRPRSMLRSNTMTSMRSDRSSTASVAPVHPEERMGKAFTGPASSGPRGQAPLDAFSEVNGAEPLDFLGESFRTLKRSDTWTPGKTIGSSHRRSSEPGLRSSEPGSAKERSSSEQSSERPKASVKSVREAAARQWRHHTEAKRRWHEAFAQAAAKRAAAPPSPLSGQQHHRQSSGPAPSPSPARSPSPDADEPGPRSAGSKQDAWAPEPDIGARFFSKASTASTATGPSTPEGQHNSSQPPEARDGTGHDANSPNAEAKRQKATNGHGPHTNSPGARRNSIGDVTAPSANDSPELRKQKQDILQRMRDLMESSIAERKKVLRELVLEWHPDKNNDPNAKDIFQFINAQRGWFLCE